MRLPKDDFRKLDLRVHSFLSDVPLVDVWVFRLRGGKNRSLADFRELMTSLRSNIHPVVATLFKLRFLLGRLFGWDTISDNDSFSNRLTESDLARTKIKPGVKTVGPFHCLYAFENEILDETYNKTVHAFSAMSFERYNSGYWVYWAIYVRKTSLLTPVYMTVISPFRRYIVYPAIIRRLESAWAESHDSNNICHFKNISLKKYLRNCTFL